MWANIRDLLQSCVNEPMGRHISSNRIWAARKGVHPVVCGRSEWAFYSILCGWTGGAAHPIQSYVGGPNGRPIQSYACCPKGVSTSRVRGPTGRHRQSRGQTGGVPYSVAYGLYEGASSPVVWPDQRASSLVVLADQRGVPTSRVGEPEGHPSQSCGRSEGASRPVECVITEGASPPDVRADQKGVSNQLSLK